jgi:acyl-coenzyme A synthetase/AMP-(fatty) acid ligase
LHIASLAAMSVELPPLAGTLSATAPLDDQLAQAFEQYSGAPLYEIYGSTETGAVGSRRAAREQDFRLLAGLRLHPGAERWAVVDGHVGAAVELQDRLETRAPDEFRLAGRVGDLVKIGGKRASLAMLDAELAEIAGVIDGVFWLPDQERATPRLMAFVVAPGVPRAHILAALRERIDPAFLPRPLVVVDMLPRDAVGKLPRAALTALAASAAGHAAPESS